MLKNALQMDYVVLGGGNAKLIEKPPPGCRIGANTNAFVGGFRLWQERAVGVSGVARNRRSTIISHTI